MPTLPGWEEGGGGRGQRGGREEKKIKGRGGEEEVEAGEEGEMRERKGRRRMQVNNKSVNFVILLHLPVIVADSSLIRARPKSQSFAWPLGGTAVRSTFLLLRSRCTMLMEWRY